VASITITNAVLRNWNFGSVFTEDRISACFFSRVLRPPPIGHGQAAMSYARTEMSLRQPRPFTTLNANFSAFGILAKHSPVAVRKIHMREIIGFVRRRAGQLQGTRNQLSVDQSSDSVRHGDGMDCGINCR